MDAIEKVATDLASEAVRNGSSVKQANAGSALKSFGSFAAKNPALVGAGLGAAAGLGSNFLRDEEDRSYLTGTVGGALAGAAIGGGGSLLYHGLAGTPASRELGKRRDEFIAAANSQPTSVFDKLPISPETVAAASSNPTVASLDKASRGLGYAGAAATVPAVYQAGRDVKVLSPLGTANAIREGSRLELMDGPELSAAETDALREQARSMKNSDIRTRYRKASAGTRSYMDSLARRGRTSLLENPYRGAKLKAGKLGLGGMGLSWLLARLADSMKDRPVESRRAVSAYHNYLKSLSEAQK